MLPSARQIDNSGSSSPRRWVGVRPARLMLRREALEPYRPADRRRLRRTLAMGVAVIPVDDLQGMNMGTIHCTTVASQLDCIGQTLEPRRCCQLTVVLCRD